MKNYKFVTKERIDKYKDFKSTLHCPTLNNEIYKNNLYRRLGAMKNLENNVMRLCSSVNGYLNKIIYTDKVRALKMGLVTEEFYPKNVKTINPDLTLI